MNTVLDQAIQICQAVKSEGGHALIVGGYARDRVMGIESKDIDIEIYGLPAEQIAAILEPLGDVNLVGESFAVFKLGDIDVSLPRRESKTGDGHKGFAVEGDPTMTVKEAARRRDFTINSIGYCPIGDEYVDHYAGIKDIERKVLRVVDPRTFVEDSLRVLRAMQFAARFELTIEEETVVLCRSIPLDDLPAERIWGEFEKLFLRASKPSIGLQAALDLCIIERLFPELLALVGCEQDPKWHPEGDVWTHTCICVDEAAKLISDLPYEKQLTVMLATLCHDLGKPGTSEVLEDRIRSYGHDEEGVVPTESVLDTLNVHTLNGYNVREQAIQVVRNHMKPLAFYEARKVGDGAFRRLARKVEPDLVYRVARADCTGRGGDHDTTGIEWFRDRIIRLGVEKEAPPSILMGRHLIPLGVEPGPGMGKILKAVYELQLDNVVTNLDEAIKEAKRTIAKKAEP